MSFHRLTEAVHGEILLLNLHETFAQARSRPANFDMTKVDDGLKTFHAQISGLPPGYSPKTLAGSIAEAVFERSHDFQFASEETPERTIYLAGVRPFADVQEVLRRCLKLRLPPKVNAQIRNAVAARPTVKAIREAAEALNHIRKLKPVLSIGNRAQIFWASRLGEVTAIEQRALSANESAAQAIRDYLGLVHYHPFKDRRSLHLFMFQAVTSVDRITELNRVCRPTTLDGFDNPRFRQYRPSVGLDGCGMTVDLTDGAYANGGPECVVSELSLINFHCRYLGPLTSKASGSDAMFRDFLSRRPRGTVLTAKEYAEMADDLDRHVN